MDRPMPSPSEPRSIKSPRYDATLNVATGIVTFTRNDESGRLSLEEVENYCSPELWMNVKYTED